MCRVTLWHEFLLDKNSPRSSIRTNTKKTQQNAVFFLLMTSLSTSFWEEKSE